MAYSEQTITERNLTTDATFRLWVQGVQAALTASGLTNTSDTGQINSTTVTLPANSAYGGYEIWRFNDTLQASRPIFFKLEYGIGASGGRAALRVTVGTGSDGAGGITGGDSAQTAIMLGTMSSGTAWVVASYFEGQFTLFAWSALGSNRALIVIERGRNLDGTYADEIIVLPAAGSSSPSANLLRARKSGSWAAATALKMIEPIAVTGGEGILGALRRSDRPARMLRSLLAGPTTLAAGDSGSVDDGVNTMTYKAPTVNSPIDAWGSTSYPFIFRSA